ncbi:MAG: hypothetical protein WBP26_05495 [Candidatus Saccharimonadales bacterium]
MQKQLANVLQKDMTRKEFFMAIGCGAAAMAGVGTLLQLFGKDVTAPFQQQATQQKSSGYGMSSYGH